MYLTDPIPPRMYGMLKAHNKSKNYLMRIVVSTIGTLSHGISKYLVDLIQPTLNKNPIRVQYSTSFILKAKANVRFHTMWWLSTLRSPYRKQEKLSQELLPLIGNQFLSKLIYHY